MSYSQLDIQKVKDQADIRDFVPGLTGRAATQYTRCPSCGKEGKGKGLCVTHRGKKNIAHCFSCGFTLGDAVAAEMYFNPSESFPEALKKVADSSGIFIESDEERKVRLIKSSKAKVKRSFCASQLASSGLSVEDVTACVKIPDGTSYVPTFRRGGMDRYGNINDSDNEMLIYYYDLNGNQVMYSRRGTGGKMLPYVRIRWSNPAMHLDREGREIKYQTPAGAPTRLYIPQYIRARYQREEHIETLIVQEGEKKAEKACKHGIASVGIQGIFNIGNEASGLVQDLQYVVQQCSVKNVVLLFDSDWENLHRNIQPGNFVDQRPNAFSKAAIKFKQYVQTLHTLGVNVDIYFGHIKENGNNDKGIDDLLTNSLNGHEADLKHDIENTLFTHDGKGRFVDIFKITTKTDNQIRDYWLLNDPEEFFKKHREQLVNLPNFRFGRMAYKVEEGKFSIASRTSERDIWKVDTNDKGKVVVNFDTYEAIEFVNANGFARIHTIDLEVDQYRFIHIEDGIVHPSGPTEIRDFVYDYVLQSTKNQEVRDYFSARLGTLLGPDKLERVKKIEDNFEVFEPHVQRLFFQNGQVDVTAAEIKYSDKILGQVWEDKVIHHEFKRVPLIEKVEKDKDGAFTVALSKEAMKCEFLRFIMNVSNFWPGKDMGSWDDDTQCQFSQHLVNKLTTIGYLLVDYKYQTELKAVVAMDGQLGDVAQSNGRTGKSLIGKALSYVLDQTYVDGRNTKNEDDFLYSNVTLRTRNIFLDDVRVNFDFEKLFGAVTGDLAVNPKAKARFIIKNERSPKFYITTNHAINAQSRSAKQRIAYMAFSNWYNDTHTPMDDFQHQLFSDWEWEQWNLFYNLLIEMVQLYFLSMEQGWSESGRGAVPPPMDDINRRTYKQLMGEAFFQWAEVYFDTDAGHINSKIPRKDMYDAFHEAYPEARFGVTPSNFRSKLTNYCYFKGYHLNFTRPNQEGATYRFFQQARPGECFIGTADKSGGVEYFTVATAEFIDKQPF